MELKCANPNGEIVVLSNLHVIELSILINYENQAQKSILYNIFWKKCLDFPQENTHLWLIQIEWIKFYLKETWICKEFFSMNYLNFRVSFYYLESSVFNLGRHNPPHEAIEIKTIFPQIKYISLTPEEVWQKKYVYFDTRGTSSKFFKIHFKTLNL